MQNNETLQITFFTNTAFLVSGKSRFQKNNQAVLFTFVVQIMATRGHTRLSLSNVFIKILFSVMPVFIAAIKLVPFDFVYHLLMDH